MGTLSLNKQCLEINVIENFFDKSCSPNLIIYKENKFQENKVNFRPLNLDPKTNQFLIALNQNVLE